MWSIVLLFSPLRASLPVPISTRRGFMASGIFRELSRKLGDDGMR